MVTEAITVHTAAHDKAPSQTEHTIVQTTRPNLDHNVNDARESRLESPAERRRDAARSTLDSALDSRSRWQHAYSVKLRLTGQPRH